MRFMFTALGLSGHLYSLVPLAWSCRTAGHDVVLCTARGAVPAAVATGLPVLAVGPDGPEIGAEGLTGAGTPSARGRLFGRVALRRLTATREAVERWRPDVLVHERAEFAGPVAAAEAGIPSAELRWSVGPMPAYAAGAGEVLARAGLAVAEQPWAPLTPWPAELRTGGREALEFRHVPYEGRADVTDLLLPPPGGPRVCLTLGTVLTRSDDHVHRAVLHEAPAALARAGFEVVVAADPDVLDAGTRPPRGVLFAGRAPVSHLMEHCDVAIHHGGHGTALAAVLAGRPSVVAPAFDDQIDNAAALAHGGAALLVDEADLTADALVDHCRRLTDDARYARGARRLSQSVRSRPALHEITARLAAAHRTLQPGHARAA